MSCLVLKATPNPGDPMMANLPRLDPLLELIIPVMVFALTFGTTFLIFDWEGPISVLTSIGLMMVAFWGVILLDDWHRNQDKASCAAFGHALETKTQTMTPEEIRDLKNTSLM